MSRAPPQRDDYGVALDADLAVDDAATAPLGARRPRDEIACRSAGALTDVTAFDIRGLVAVRKYVSNPAQPAAVMETITADLARDFGPDAVTLILHRLDHRAQHAARRQGRTHGTAHDARLPRRVRDRAAVARRGCVQHLRAGTEDAAAARPHLRDRRRIGSRARSSIHCWRRTSAGAVRLVAEGSTVAVCFLLPTPTPPTSKRRPDHSHDRARSLRIAVARGQPGMARIRAHGIDGGHVISGHRSRATCGRWKS